MAKWGSNNVAFFLVDGYDLMGLTTQFTQLDEALFEETHCLGDTWVAQAYVGIRKGEFEQSGFFDDGTNLSNTALVGQTSSRLLMFGVASETLGQPMVAFAGAMQIDYQRVATRGALHKANAKYKGNGAVEYGKILLNHTTKSSASNSDATSVDNAASSANGGAVYVAVSAITLGGYTNWLMKLRHSTDNITFVDHTTVMTATAAPSMVRTAIAGTINRYTSISWALTGAGSGPSIKFAAGLIRS